VIAIAGNCTRPNVSARFSQLLIVGCWWKTTADVALTVYSATAAVASVAEMMISASDAIYFITEMIISSTKQTVDLTKTWVLMAQMIIFTAKKIRLETEAIFAIAKTMAFMTQIIIAEANKMLSVDKKALCLTSYRSKQGSWLESSFIPRNFAFPINRSWDRTTEIKEVKMQNTFAVSLFLMMISCARADSIEMAPHPDNWNKVQSLPVNAKITIYLKNGEEISGEFIRLTE
jgi:hypothetical protein